MQIIYNSTFFIFTLFALQKATAYGLYEYKQKNNKFGGIAIISLSIFTIILSNILLFIKL